MTTWTPKPMAAATLRDQAYDVIKEGILRLELRPGEPLVEAALAERLGISKSPVRDALHQLEREGLAVRTPFKGVQVAPLEPEEVLDAFEVRDALEERAIRRCSGRLAPADTARVQGIIDAGKAALAGGDAGGIERSVDAFHREIARLSGSPLLAQMLDNVYDRLARVRAMVVGDPSRSATSLVEHAAILDRIVAGDAEGAVAAGRAHGARLLREITALLELPMTGGPR